MYGGACLLVRRDSDPLPPRPPTTAPDSTHAHEGARRSSTLEVGTAPLPSHATLPSHGRGCPGARGETRGGSSYGTSWRGAACSQRASLLKRSPADDKPGVGERRVLVERLHPAYRALPSPSPVGGEGGSAPRRGYLPTLYQPLANLFPTFVHLNPSECAVLLGTRACRRDGPGLCWALAGLPEPSRGSPGRPQ